MIVWKLLQNDFFFQCKIESFSTNWRFQVVKIRLFQYFKVFVSLSWTEFPFTSKGPLVLWEYWQGSGEEITYHALVFLVFISHRVFEVQVFVGCWWDRWLLVYPSLRWYFSWGNWGWGTLFLMFQNGDKKGEGKYHVVLHSRSFRIQWAHSLLYFLWESCFCYVSVC